MAASTEVVVSYKVGLHARPATVFAKTALRFSSAIFIENLTKGSAPVNAKSPLLILGARVQRHDRMRITANGTDEEAAIEALKQLVVTNFGEAE